MAMRKYLIICMILSGLCLTSCKQDQYFLFNDQARLQFGLEKDGIYKSDYDLADTTKRQALYYLADEVARDTVYFDLYTIGNTVSEPRSFTLRQVPVEGEDNAVAGTDYLAFDDPEVRDLYQIGADSVHAF